MNRPDTASVVRLAPTLVFNLWEVEHMLEETSDTDPAALADAAALMLGAIDDPAAVVAVVNSLTGNEMPAMLLAAVEVVAWLIEFDDDNFTGPDGMWMPTRDKLRLLIAECRQSV